jgi:hypothetical protein
MARPYGNRRRPGHDRGRRDNLTMAIGPGKFEGELALAEWAHETSLDGCAETIGDEFGGESDTLLEGPFRPSELRDWRDGYGRTLNRSDRLYAKGSAGCILHETSNGFVSATFYPRTADGRAVMDADWSAVQASYASDDTEDKEA